MFVCSHSEDEGYSSKTENKQITQQIFSL